MSDNVNRIIQKARIGEERAERLLEEMGVMQAEIDRLTAALEDARGKALEEAIKEIEASFRRHMDAAPYAKELLKRVAFEQITAIRALVKP